MCRPPNIFWPLHWTDVKFGAVVAHNEYVTHFDFQVTCLKVKVKPRLWVHCVIRSISFDPFTWLIPNLVQGLRLRSRWSQSIFRSHVQMSRSNHSFEPSVISTLYIVIPCLLPSDRFCFYREDTPGCCTMGAYLFLKHFLFFNDIRKYTSCWHCTN